MTKRPHIIMTIADDQRYDAMAALGDTSLKTPTLDGLLAQGCCYSRAYIPGSTHGAVCAPSRAQLHTGRTLFQTKDDLNSHQGQPLPTLGQQLGECGYHTSGVGKWHNSDEAFRRSFQQGRSVFHGGMSSHFCVGSVNYLPDTTGKTQRSSMAGHSVDLFAGAALEALKHHQQHASDQPLFLYVAMTAPHDPRDTYWRFRKQFARENMTLPASYMDRHPFDNGVLNIRDEYLADMPRSPEEIQQHAADYAAILMHMDEGIGRIHAAANAAGFTTDNTLFVHTADHGIAIGRHGLMGKQNLYDHSVRPPLVVAGPGFERGVTDDRLCYMQDLFPTLLEAAGATVPDDNRYINLTSTQKRKTIGAAYADLMRMTRNERYKLIHTHAAGLKHRQLFDLQNDPHECVNLLGNDDAAFADVVRELDDALMSWRDWASDPSARFG